MKGAYIYYYSIEKRNNVNGKQAYFAKVSKHSEINDPIMAQRGAVGLLPLKRIIIMMIVASE